MYWKNNLLYDIMFKIKEKSLKELNGLEIFEIRELVRSIGEKDFRGNQLFSFFYKNKRVDWNSMCFFGFFLSGTFWFKTITWF